MTDTSPLPGELGRGSLGRVTVALHRVAVITAAFVLASLPAALPALVEPSLLTVVVGVLLLAVIAVALSAALVAWHDEIRAVHPAPWTAFWRGYRRNAVDVLLVVLPGLVPVAIVAATLSDVDGAGVDAGYGWLLVVIAGVVSLIATRAVVIATFLSFRVRDTWRLAVFTLFRRPRSTLSLVALMICAIGVVWLTNEAVLLLLGGIAARLLLRYEAPAIELVRDQFTHEGQGSAT